MAEYNKEIKRALRILKLNKSLPKRERLALLEVEKAYKKLAWMYHPDRCPEAKKSACKKKFIEVNLAKEILKDYCTGSYKYSSDEGNKERMKRYKEHIDHVKRFYDGWWGDLDF